MMAHTYPAARSSFGSPVVAGLRYIGALAAMALFGLSFGSVAYDTGSATNLGLSYLGLGGAPDTTSALLAYSALFALLTIPVGFILSWLMGSAGDVVASLRHNPMSLLNLGGGTASLALVLMAVAHGTPILLAPVALYLGAIFLARVIDAD